MRLRRPAPGPLVAVVLAGSACTVDLGGGATDPDGPGPGLVCDVASPGASPLRRLSRFEYDNTVRDLLGDDRRPAADFPADSTVHGFDNQAEVMSVPVLLAESYQLAAEALAERAVADLPALLPCDPAADEAACADAFIADLGGRAYRRPLLAAEQVGLRAVFDAGAAEADFALGAQLVIEVLLQSPHFLYRVEGGLDATAAATPLSDHELASRLSYLVWGSMPDDVLFEAAASGALRDRGAIEAQARRMLADPRAEAAIARFFEQWLGLGAIAELEKDPDVYPAFDRGLRPLLAQETASFLAHVFWNGVDAHELLTADYSFMNQELADFYGVPGPGGEAFARVALDPAQRAGLLTHAGVLATHAKFNQSSPIHRGKFVREQLLCTELAPPPPGTNADPPPLDPSLTTRERFAQHVADPLCGGCHALIDPIGFALEHFDGIGRWRDAEGDAPIDARGEVTSSDVGGALDGAAALAAKLASSAQVERCVVTQTFRYAYGRDADVDADRCTSEALYARFVDSGYDLRELIVSLTQTDAFLFKAGETTR